MLECYLVVEVSPDEVLFIDQHALHERILYEQFQERLRSGTLEVQRLLIPEPVELPSAQAAVVLEQRQALAELGLLVDDFGGGTVLLTGYPAVLGKRSPREVFQAVVDQLIGKERVPSREQLLNDLMSLMACHAAVRAGDRLTQEEIKALLDQAGVSRSRKKIIYSINNLCSGVGLLASATAGRSIGEGSAGKSSHLDPSPP